MNVTTNCSNDQYKGVKRWKTFVPSKLNAMFLVHPLFFFLQPRYFDQVGQWDKIFSSFDRMIVIYLGAFVMRLVSANLKKKHELDDDVRYELNSSVNRFVKSALKTGAKRFAGGDRVSLADLALYGAMTSFQGCGAFQDMINANDVIKKWFYDVQKAVDSHEGQAAIKELKKDEEVVVVLDEAIVE